MNNPTPPEAKTPDAEIAMSSRYGAPWAATLTLRELQKARGMSLGIKQPKMSERE